MEGTKLGLTTTNDFGTYMDDGVRKIDFVFIYTEEDGDLKKKCDKKEQEERRKFYEENLVQEGIELEYDRQMINGEEVTFVKLHVPWPTLCKYAEELKIKTPMRIKDEKRMQMSSAKNGKGLFVSHEKVNNVIRKHFMQRDIGLLAIDDQNTYFTDIQRIEITEEILQNASCDPKNLKVRGIEKMVEDKIYEAAYPLHDCELDSKNDYKTSVGQRQHLRDTWASWKNVFKVQPLTEVRNYYGEQVAFYFAWMDVYGKLLILPSIVGMCTFIYGLLTTAYSPEYDEICRKDRNNEAEMDPFNVIPLTMCPICKPPNCDPWEMIPDGCFQYGWNYRLDNEGSILLTIFTSLWGIIFLKVWKRREAYLAAEWDSHDAENTDNLIRPEYAESATAVKENPVTNQQEPHIPSGKMKMRLFGSICGTIAFLFFTGILLVGLILSRIQLYGALRPILGTKNIDGSRWITHILLLIMVMILEIIFNVVAEKLTNFECPRTKRRWMKSFLWKMFIFQYINEFVPIAYAAWIKGKVTPSPLNLGVMGELCDGGCIGEVTEIVSVLLLMRLVLANSAELGIPMIQTGWRRFRSKAKVVQNDASSVPQYVKDYHLNEIELDGVSEDLMQMVVQYAFNVLLIPALPVVPLVCLMNTIIQTRLDSIKYLRTRRRVVPIRTSGIHIWDQFLDITSKLGIFVNAAMLAFTGDNVPKLYYKWVYNPGNGIHGFTRFSLDRVNTTDYDIDPADNEMLKHNITECWYPGFKESEPPFQSESLYWQIIALKWVAFGLFVSTLFTIMWIINTFVSDVPQTVKEKIQRRQFIISKAKETTTVQKQVSANENDEKREKRYPSMSTIRADQNDETNF